MSIKKQAEALREARELAQTTLTRPSPATTASNKPSDWTDADYIAFLDGMPTMAEELLILAVEARTIAKLRAGVVPLTMTAEREGQIRKWHTARVNGDEGGIPAVQDLTVELDATRAALAEARGRAERMEEDRDLQASARKTLEAELATSTTAIGEEMLKRIAADKDNACAKTDLMIERDDARAELAEALAVVGAADAILADDDQFTHGHVLCGYCGAVKPDERCATNCLNEAYRVARAVLGSVRGA